MMKEVTILTSDETERIKDELDSMIDEANDGAYGDSDPKGICKYLVGELRKLRKMFE